MDWVLWSGTADLQRPVPERLAAAAVAGCSSISISPLDVQVAAAEGMTADDLRRSVRPHGLCIIFDPVLNWHPAQEPSTSIFAPFGLAELLYMSQALGCVAMTAVAMSTTSVSIEGLGDAFGHLCDQALSIGVYRGNPDFSLLRQIPGHRIAAVQVSDADTTVRCDMRADAKNWKLPGDGALDLKQALTTLSDIGGLTRIGAEVISPDTARPPAADAASHANDRVRLLLNDIATANSVAQPGRPASYL